MINNFINSVSVTFEEYCNTGLKEQTYLGYYHGNGTTRLNLKNRFISEIQSIQFRNSTKDNYQDLYTGGFTIENEIRKYDSYIENNSLVFPYGIQNIKIQYKAGFNEDTLEGQKRLSPLKDICIEAVMEKYSYTKLNQGGSRLGLKSKSDLNGNTESYYELWEIHRKVLDNYKKAKNIVN